MQIYADVTGCELRVAASKQTPALGSAMFAAVAAGAHETIVDAAERMAGLGPERYVPDAAARAVYDRLYREYRRLHDLFGRGGDEVMRTLKAIQSEVERSAR
jgi:L-ribulokinase